MTTKPPPISTELGLLVATDLASDEMLAARVEQARASGIDWVRFEGLAVGHSMGGIAGARLADVAPGAVPENLALSLRSILRKDTAAQLAQTAESANLTRWLDAAGIRSIVLKGVALSHMLYGTNPQWRRSSDIDLLVDRQDFLAADHLLQGKGYLRTWPEGELPHAGLDMLLHLANVFNYISPTNGQVIELHHRIALNPYWLPASFDELLTNSCRIETASGPVHGLNGAQLVAYLSWHALGHIGFRLKWFCDIARLLRQLDEPDCATCLSGSTTFGPGPSEVVDLVLAVAANATGLTVREDRIARWRRDVDRIIDDMENVSEMPTLRTCSRLPLELAHLRFLMKLSTGVPARAFQVLRAVSDPRDAWTLGLGRNYAVLYAALGPLLAARRFLSTRSNFV